MRLLDSEELRATATARALPWGAVAPELAWRDALRAHVAAEGVVPRRVLVDRVLDWHDAASDEALREQVNRCVDDLDAVGDLLVGARGLVGAAPVRAARLRGAGTVLLLGSIGTDALRRALPSEVVEDRRVRRVVLSWHDGDALARAMHAIGATVTDADAWAGLDRAPATLDAWWRMLGELGARSAVSDLPLDDAQAYVVRDGRGRWRPRAEAPDDAARLLRVRQPGGWHRFVWDRDGVGVALTTDEATRTVLALEARAGAARTVTATRCAEGGVEFTRPGRLPHAEYRMLLGTADARRDDGDARLVASWDVWPNLAAMLRARLGWTVDEAGLMR